MSEEYLRQMRQLERQEADLTSQYTDLERLDKHDYKKVINANITYAPHKGGVSWMFLRITTFPSLLIIFTSFQYLYSPYDNGTFLLKIDTLLIDLPFFVETSP